MNTQSLLLLLLLLLPAIFISETKKKDHCKASEGQWIASWVYGKWTVSVWTPRSELKIRRATEYFDELRGDWKWGQTLSWRPWSTKYLQKRPLTNIHPARSRTLFMTKISVWEESHRDHQKRDPTLHFLWKRNSELKKAKKQLLWKDSN